MLNSSLFPRPFSNMPFPSKNVPPVPPRPERGQNCAQLNDWNYGPDVRLLVQNGRASLSEVANAGPPIRYKSIAEGNGGRYTTITEIQIPNGYVPIQATITSGLNEPQVGSYVSFRLFLGDSPLHFNWLGSISTPFPYPLFRYSKDGSKISLRAIIEPTGWSSGSASTKPIRSQVIAYGVLELLVAQEGMMK